MRIRTGKMPGSGVGRVFEGAYVSSESLSEGDGERRKDDQLIKGTCLTMEPQRSNTEVERAFRVKNHPKP